MYAPGKIVFQNFEGAGVNARRRNIVTIDFFFLSCFIPVKWMKTNGTFGSVGFCYSVAE